MDRFVAEHLASDGASGSLTMAYYDREDLGLYHALADAFTLCDAYHCSVLGPTDPNRLYAMSATLDPDGTHGGPLVHTLTRGRAAAAGRLTWATMPERLSAAGVSWKVYTGRHGGLGDNVLPYFRAFQADPALRARGLDPVYPEDFLADLGRDELPQVSWVLVPIGASEHPGRSGPLGGMAAARRLIGALAARPAVWERTALLITWDENGGFFDHVAPTTAPPGTPGEHLTVAALPAAAEGVRGPIGLGVRVPLLVVSPFSRGGFVCSDVFDHTSILRFLERRFGVEVPNLSAWRRSVTGDLTSAFSFAQPDPRPPSLPPVVPRPRPGPHADCVAAAPVAVAARAHARAGAGAGAAAVGPRGRPRRLGRQRRGPGDGQDAPVGQLADEELDALGVELAPGVAAQLVDRLGRGPRAAVGAIAGHRVVGVGDEEDARGVGDRRAREAVGVAGAVEALVGMADPGRHGLQALDPSDDLGPGSRVLGHQGVLLGCQRPRLAQDVLGDADLAHVVEHRGEAHEAHLRLGPAQARGDRGGVVGHGVGVLVGDRHPLVDRGGQRGGPAELARLGGGVRGAVALAVVELGVGGLLQAVGGRGVEGEHGDPRRGRRTLGERAQEAVDDRGRPGAVLVQQDGELVAAEAADDVAPRAGSRTACRRPTAAAGRRRRARPCR